jgi:hypothetical protein
MLSGRLLLALMFVVAAQRAAPQGVRNDGMAFDATIGLGRPLDGKYLFSAGPAFDAILAIPIRQPRTGGATFGLAGGAQFGLPVGDKCVFDPHGGCLENLPSVRSLVALAGLETHARGDGSAPRWSLRALVGPGVDWVGGEDYGEHATALGLHARLDAASPAWGKVAFVTSIRGALLPSSPLDVGGIGSVGIGIRFR